MTATTAPPALTWDVMKSRLAALLDAIPTEWRGTTYKNKILYLREGFIERLDALLADTDTPITAETLTELGNAEDYMRVATNLSVVLERTLAFRRDMAPASVFTFASTRMPVIAVLMTHPGQPVHLYHGDKPAPFSAELVERLRLSGCLLTQHPGAPPPAGERPHGEAPVVALGAAAGSPGEREVDAIVEPCVLYAVNATRVVPADILVIRKRMATPVTTPVAEAMLRALISDGDLSVAAAGSAPPSDAELLDFHTHLETLSGSGAGAAECDRPAEGHCHSPDVACFTAGLPTLASLWLSFVGNGGVDILMCSTAYGGSSQLADLLAERSELVSKHTFDIQGTASIVPSIGSALETLGARPAAELHDTTVLFVEVPTNPDMKVPDVGAVADMLRAFRKRTGKGVLLLVDATFAPGSQVMRKVRAVAPELPCIVFLSMSKSVSRGVTTAGSLIANHTAEARSLLDDARATGAALDTLAKPDQLRRLVDNHTGVEDRCARAYENARVLGEALQAAVRTYAPNKPDMPLAFVSKENAADGFTTSTFSFNLPPRANADAANSAALAQQFVDALCRDARFKPCVSFGQDNGLVYATVPATSTQGAIKEEHKAKQAVGGVQLTRLSFPPSLDVEGVSKLITDAVREMYA